MQNKNKQSINFMLVVTHKNTSRWDQKGNKVVFRNNNGLSQFFKTTFGESIYEEQTVIIRP